MRGRANLLIFVFVSLAVGHREGLPRVQVRPLVRMVCHRKRDSIEARFKIDGLGIARYTLRYGLNTNKVARWSPRGWAGSARAAWTRPNDV